MHHGRERLFAERMQKLLPLEIHPEGHVPKDDLGTTSWAPCDGMQNDPSLT
jgi:hypothetical protein